MHTDLLSLGFEDYNNLREIGEHYSSEASDLAFVSFEDNKFVTFFNAIADRFRPSRVTAYRYDSLPPVAPLYKTLAAKGYTAIKGIEIETPTSLLSTLPEFTQFYTSLVLKMQQFPAQLDAFYRVLGELLNNPNAASAQSSLLSLYNPAHLVSPQDRDRLVHMFDGSGRTTAPFGKMYDRVADYASTYGMTDQLGKAAAAVDVPAVVTKLARFDPLIKQLRANLLRDQVEVSGPFVGRLIEYTTALATTAEQIGSMNNLVTEIVETQRRNYKLLTEATA